MKKFLVKISLLSAFFLMSCVHENQVARLDFTLPEKESTIGKGIGISVKVIDERSNTDTVGRKRFGKERIHIKTDQELAAFLQDKIFQNLADRGFSQGKDKTVEIRIKSFKYNAWRRFPVGASEAHAMVKVVVKNGKIGKEFTKNYNLSLVKKHFIAPLEITDEETINFLLKEITQNILSDDDFMKNLVQ